MLRGMIFLLLFLLLTGCGTEKPSHKEDVSLRTLYFIDSPVDGISYSCGIRKGVTKIDPDTGKHGVFYCKDESVSFSLGTLKIGTIEKFVNGDEIHPQNFVKETPHDYFNNDDVLKLAMLLQSLDDDKNITEYINILPETVEKLKISSLKKLTMKQVQDEIIRIGKTPRNFNAMKEHLIAYSHIPEINNPTIIYVKDNQAIGSYLDDIIPIKSKQYISKIDIISEDDKTIDGNDYFQIEKNGSIKLKKSLDFKTKNYYNFQIVAVTPLGSSKNAQLTINVDSSIEGENNFIHKAVVSNNIIYTKDLHYNITVYGKKNTKIYINNKFVKIMPSSGSTPLTLTAPNKDGEYQYNIILKYDNGISSDPISYTVIKDTVAPIITTPSPIVVDENMELLENIDVDENNNYGLKYTLSGIDSHYFNISNNGKLIFSTPVSFENPTDNNKDNKYEIIITATDMAGNSSSPKKITISVGDILNSPPIIGTFNEQINSSLIVGSIIGKVAISDGNSSITNLYLEGDGKEYFDIHDNGDIILLQRVPFQKTFNLVIVAINEFGKTRQNITIKVIEKTANARAKIKGNLSGATVKLIKLNSNNTKKLISTSTTTSTGDFDLKTSLLDDNSFYIYELSNGIDNNTQQQNQGVLRLITKGSWVKNSSNKIIVTPLSEMIYDYVAYYIKYNYSQIENKLNESAKILLEKDLTGNYVIDAKDILIFNPTYNQQSLYPTLKYNNSYQTITNKIQLNNLDYIKDLFNSKVTKSFVDVVNTKKSGIASYVGDIKFSGTVAYYHQGDTFYTYDMYNKKILGTLKLEKQDLSTIDPISLFSLEPNAFDIKLYLDLNQNRVYIENLNQKIFIVDVSNIRKPKLLKSFQTPFWSTYIKLIINNKLYLKSSSTIYNIFNIYDMTNLNNIRQLNDVRVNMFTHISKNKAYNVSTDNCLETNQLTITTYYSLQDILTDNSNKKIYYLPTNNCYRDEINFDDNYMYVYSHNKYLKIYSLSEYSSEPILISTFPYHVTKILNQDDKILYVYADNHIYFIDITDMYSLKIKKDILYRYKYNSTEYFTDTNNLKITIKDNFIVESSRLIDLNSHILSSIYTETNNGIDMSLFQKY